MLTECSPPRMTGNLWSLRMASTLFSTSADMASGDVASVTGSTVAMPLVYTSESVSMSYNSMLADASRMASGPLSAPFSHVLVPS